MAGQAQSLQPRRRWRRPRRPSGLRLATAARAAVAQTAQRGGAPRAGAPWRGRRGKGHLGGGAGGARGREAGRLETSTTLQYISTTLQYMQYMYSHAAITKKQHVPNKKQTKCHDRRFMNRDPPRAHTARNAGKMLPRRHFDTYPHERHERRRNRRMYAGQKLRHGCRQHVELRAQRNARPDAPLAAELPAERPAERPADAANAKLPRASASADVVRPAGGGGSGRGSSGTAACSLGDAVHCGHHAPRRRQVVGV
eukprot:277743-Chlamydomonas_euryale.AAC.1